MLAALLWGCAPVEAAYVASCAASIVVEARGGGSLDRVRETPARLASYGRRYGVDVAVALRLARAHAG